jgi:1,4-alpha-glucan branching enzyme
MGIVVLLDVVHSHISSNADDGLAGAARFVKAAASCRKQAQTPATNMQGCVHAMPP